MRFLVDECTGPRVAEWLHSQGHEIFSVFEEARGIEDDEVIQMTKSRNLAIHGVITKFVLITPRICVLSVRVSAVNNS